MDFKGSDVKEIRTGRIGTVICSNIDTVDVQYEGLRKLKCKWNQVQLLNDKDRVRFDKAIQKIARESELKSKELAKNYEKKPASSSVPQRHGYVIWTIFAAILVFAVFSVKTPPPSQSEKINTSYRVSKPDAISNSDKSRSALSELISPASALHHKHNEPSLSQMSLAELIDVQIDLTRLNYDGSHFYTDQDYMIASQAIQEEITKKLFQIALEGWNSDLNNLPTWNKSQYPRIGCAENGSCYGDISKINGMSKTIRVEGYYRSDGTYVRGHYRSKGR